MSGGRTEESQGRLLAPAESVKQLEQLERERLEQLERERLKRLEQLEKIFSLLLAGAPELRRNLALVLFIGYSEFATFNAVKAEFYLATALLLPTPENSIDFTASFFSWFTTIRLGVLRGAREYSLYSNLAIPDMGPYFSVLQLSYLPETLLYLVKLLSQGLRPKQSENEWWYNRLEWKRLKQVLLSREFLSALTNALGWLLVNGICYLSGAPAVVCCILNLIGFVADIFHDYWFAKKELEEWKKLRDDNSLWNDPDLEQLVRRVDFKQLNDKIIDLNNKLLRVTLVALFIFVGMALFYCPVFLPALPVLLFQMLGATTVLGGGVIAGGLLGRLARLDMNKQKERLIKLSNQERLALAITILLVSFTVLGAFSFIPVPVFFILASAMPIVYLAAKKIMDCRPPEVSSLPLPSNEQERQKCDAVTIIRTKFPEEMLADKVTMSRVNNLYLNRPKNPAFNNFYAALNNKNEQVSELDSKTLQDEPSKKSTSVFHLVPTLFKVFSPPPLPPAYQRTPPRNKSDPLLGRDRPPPLYLDPELELLELQRAVSAPAPH